MYFLQLLFPLSFQQNSQKKSLPSPPAITHATTEAVITSEKDPESSAEMISPSLLRPSLLRSLSPHVVKPLRPVVARTNIALAGLAGRRKGEVEVRIVEVGARDGLQNEKVIVPLETKIALIERLSKTGLKCIEAGSFVSPKWVPQMADTSSILSHLTTKPPVAPVPISYSYLTPNLKGLESYLSSFPRTAAPSPHNSEIAIFASASESFSQKNINCSIAESLLRFAPLVSQALSHGLRVRGYVSMVVGCPYDGPTPPEKVAEVVEGLLEMGCYEVSLGDTNGVGTPGSVVRLLQHLIGDRKIPVEKLAAHFHDTYGQAIVNCLVALEAGVRTFDSSVAGLGGCPYSKGATGNVATEDLVYFLEGTGTKTNVDLDKLVEVGDWISKQLGRKNGSKVGTALMAKRPAREESRL